MSLYIYKSESDESMRITRSNIRVVLINQSRHRRVEDSSEAGEEPIEAGVRDVCTDVHESELCSPIFIDVGFPTEE